MQESDFMGAIEAENARLRGLRSALEARADCLGFLQASLEACARRGAVVRLRGGDGGPWSVELVLPEVAPVEPEAAPEARSVTFTPEARETPVTPEAVAGASVTKSGPWGADELAEGLRLAQAGRSNAEIAAALNRHVLGVGPALKLAFRRQAGDSAGDDEGDADHEPGWLDDGAPVVNLVAAPRPEPGAPVCAWATHVAGLIYGDGWAPADDLRLVEMLVRGDGLSAAAAAFGTDRAALRDRWRLLNRHAAPSVEGQAKLLDALRARCAAVAA